MRKNIFILMAVAAMASVSCVKENNASPDQVVSGDQIVLNATVESGLESKTVLSEGSVLWNNADAIAVWNGTAVAEFVTNAENGSATATFVTTAAEYAPAETYQAVYPYAPSATFAGGKVTSTIPAVQAPYAGGFSNGTNVTVAEGTAENLQFKNVCGYIKFTVPAGMEDLTKVEFKANAGEALAGDVLITIADEPLAEVTANESDTVVMEGEFAAGQSYYIAVLPQTLTGGFTITMTQGETVKTMNTVKAFTVTRSKAKPVGELYDGTWNVVLEGTAVPEAAQLKLTQTLENENLFACLENLNAGNLNLRVLYENLYITTDGGSYTDGEKTAFTTSAQACDFAIAEAGLYRIVLNKETNELTIYSPETNPKNKTVIFKRTQGTAVDPCTVEVTRMWLYGSFNDDGNKPNDNFILQQSLADPRLFVYKGATLPRKKSPYATKFLATNHHNNEYAFGSGPDRDKWLTVEGLGLKTAPLYGGQGNNRYAWFNIPEGTNYVEVYIGDESTDENEHALSKVFEISGSYVIFDQR